MTETLCDPNPDQTEVQVVIILDACTIRALGLKDSSVDFLRALRAVGERVAIPWMVAEELLAQRVSLHEDAHAAASAALKGFARHTPWNPRTHLDDADSDRVREYWRAVYDTVVETLPPSPTAMRDALYREANALPPCRQGKAKKGARDALIWLTAVEFARENQGETVYFVSDNTTDFGNGSTYDSPMDRDVVDLGDRFVHLTTLDEVLERFTKPAKTDESLATEILRSPTVCNEIAHLAERTLGRDGRTFPCTTLGREVGQETAVMPGVGWLTVRTSLRSAEKIQAYRIGDNEWYTAIARWRISGMAYFGEDEFSAGSAGASWTTSVLFTPNASRPRLTILRHDLPLPLPTKEFASLELTHAVTSLTPLAEAVMKLGPALERLARLPRGYDGALAKQARRGELEQRLAAELAKERDSE
ncbi:PIN domain-containing protein [Streptomyces endophyticus]|uniref:PIN domain-containing protein n=1 Tax=Streptomyces endophyticus TaxID=714166 RepID=A0ABU6FF05_9ACTN|nr:PIN domain-containing protein [Streptomyces endophyticus]MEB8342569.1 PIN domain-containing protein [Streptomyces endophyticus]